MNRPAQPLIVHDFTVSGHCHRVRLMLSLLGLSFVTVPVDLVGGEHRRAPFLALNPFGQVPVLQDGAVTIADSNAILVYLASRYGGEQWLPREPLRAAAVQRWLSVAAGEIAYGPAAVRAATLFGIPCDVPAATRTAERLLLVMEATLGATSFLVGAEPTIADVAAYSYVAHAPEGRLSLAPYPQVQAWLARIEALPGFVAMPRTPVPAAA